MLILQTLAANQSMHGFEIASYIQEHSADVLQVEEGSLYPALQRMLLNGWLTGEWDRTDENHRARYYRLTAAGRKALRRERQRYGRVTQAIARVLQNQPA
jgi:PadR family transcriptional regulator